MRGLRMPLRAKIDSAMLPVRNYTAATAAATSNEVLFRPNGAVREVVLNRPKTLNAINENMVELMLPRLQEYLKSETASMVLIKGAGGRALSAGGDVKYLAQLSKEKGLEAGGREGSRYFRTEFSLNHLVATYTKPYVALMDGIVMGGGVGVSAHGSHRVGSEKTRIAMPETKIGYYPDVGGLWFLSRLDGHLGEYMALTSESLLGWTAYQEGLVSHYVPSEKIEDVERRLAELTTGAPESEEYYEAVSAAIEEFSETPANPKQQFSPEERELIDVAFAHDTVEAIIEHLETSGGDFGKRSAAAIKERAPTSLKVTLAAIRRFRKLDLKAALEVEAHLASNFCFNPDFSEGVIALLVDKRAPQWQPASLGEVSTSRVESFFSANELATDLPPIPFTNERTFEQYPHRFGLPSEAEIKAFVIGETSSLETKASVKDVYAHFERTRPKAGLRERIDSVLARKTSRDKEFPELLDWKY